MNSIKKQMAFVLITFAFIGCGNDKTPTEQIIDETNVMDQEVILKEVPVVDPFFGTYQLIDMIPVSEGKKLTPQDEKYIKESKKRTLGKTSLTFNEDGTFEQVFPDPSGNGLTNTWNGTFIMDKAAGTLVMNAQSNGKTMPINFTIVEKSANRLSIKSDFGQIFMTYVYTK